MTMFGAPLEVLHALIEQRELIVVNNNAGRVLALARQNFDFKLQISYGRRVWRRQNP